MKEIQKCSYRYTAEVCTIIYLGAINSSHRRSVYHILYLLCRTQTYYKHGVVTPCSKQRKFLIQHSSYISWKRLLNSILVKCVN